MQRTSIDAYEGVTIVVGIVLCVLGTGMSQDTALTMPVVSTISSALAKLAAILSLTVVVDWMARNHKASR